MHKVLLFDFDGTIANSYKNFLEILTILSAKYNLPAISPQDLEKLRAEEARAIITYLKIPFYKIPFLARDMKKLQHEKIADLTSFANLPEVLHTLKDRGFNLGILTSNGKENVKLFVKKNNIDVFDYLYSDTSLFGKDKVINKFIKQHGYTKNDVFYVGDEIRDIQACKKVGIKIIAVTWGFNTKEGLAKHHPDFLIHQPKDLLKLLEEKQ